MPRQDNLEQSDLPALGQFVHEGEKEWVFRSEFDVFFPQWLA